MFVLGTTRKGAFILEQGDECGPGQSALGVPLWAGFWTRWPSEVASNLNNYVILWYNQNFEKKKNKKLWVCRKVWKELGMLN